MADNTLHAQWIVTIHGNLDILFMNRPDVFVAMDNLVHPVEGVPTICCAPYVYVAFGHPKGHRSSSKVWEEGGTLPQVIFEIVSPGNTASDMLTSLKFYRHYRAEECYIRDPTANTLEIWLKANEHYEWLRDTDGFISPRLGIRFVLTEGDGMAICRPDGRRFLTFSELSRSEEAARQRDDTERQGAERLAAKFRSLGIDPDGGVSHR